MGHVRFPVDRAERYSRQRYFAVLREYLNSRTSCPGPAVLLAAALLACVLAPIHGAAEDTRVEVAADQETTVVGSFDSLMTLLTDLCTAAQVELRSYDAPDRPITANLEQRPLREVIERLLAKENYLLGVRGGRAAGSSVEVAWIRVTGGSGSATDLLSRGLTAPSEFGKTEFDRENSADALRAQQAVADRLLANPAQVDLFLRMDPAALADSLAQYPHIDVVLRKLRAEQDRPDIIQRLDAVISELATRAPTN